MCRITHYSERCKEAVDLDEIVPFYAFEHAAVALANDVDAARLLCDEFNRLGLIHVSLPNTRLVTNTILRAVFVRTGRLPSGVALDLLDWISEQRSWENNSDVERARSLFEG